MCGRSSGHFWLLDLRAAISVTFYKGSRECHLRAEGVIPTNFGGVLAGPWRGVHFPETPRRCHAAKLHRDFIELLKYQIEKDASGCTRTSTRCYSGLPCQCKLWNRHQPTIGIATMHSFTAMNHDQALNRIHCCSSWPSSCTSLHVAPFKYVQWEPRKTY